MRFVVKLLLSFVFTCPWILSELYGQGSNCDVSLNLDWKQEVSSKIGRAKTLALPDGGYLYGYNFNYGYGITRLDKLGNEIWDQKFESNSNRPKYLQSFIVLSDDQVLLGITEDNRFPSLIKINLQGDIIWTKSLVNTSIENLEDFLLLPDDHILVGGSNSNPASYILKVSPDGDIIWEKELPVYRYFINEMQFSPDGNILLGGEEIWLVDFNLWSKLLKIDLEGNLIWERRIRNNFSNTYIGFSVLPTGETVFFTNSLKQNDNVFSTGTYVNCWIAKVDANGEITQRRSLEIDAYSITKISTLTNGNTLAGATSDEEASDIKSQNSVGEDYWLLEFDDMLDIVWDLTIIGQSDEELSDMIVGPEGEIVLAGIVDEDQGELARFEMGDILNARYSLLLKDARFNDNNIIQEIKDGDNLDLQQISSDYFSLEIFNSVADDVGSVFLKLEGPISIEKTDNSYPFTLFGDYTKETGNLLGRKFPPGEYTLSITTYCQDDLQGDQGNTQSFSFQISQQASSLCKYPIEWDKTFGGNSIDDFTNMLSLPDGSFLFGGASSTLISGDKTAPNKGSYDYWIVKTDAQGNKIWDKSYGGDAYEFLYDMLLLPDGNILLGGESRSSSNGDKSEESRGVSDFWVVKIDPNGNIIWDKTFGSNHIDRLDEMILSPDGNIILGGQSSSSGNGDKSEPPRGGADYWVLKINTDGNKIWDRTFGGSDNDLFSSIAVFPNGDILLGGYSFSGISGDKSEEKKISNSRWPTGDYWLIKISSEGNKIWDRTYGGDEIDYPQDILILPNGEFWVLGYSDSGASGDKTEASQGEDFWLIHCDQDGNLIKEALFGGKGTDQGWTIQPYQDGFLLGGRSDSGISSQNKSGDSRGGQDYWTVYIDQDANMIWDQTFGGSENDFYTDMATLADGSIILGGDSHSQKSFEKSEDSRGGKDYWALKLNPSLPTLEPALNLKLFVLDANQDATLQEIISGEENLVWAPYTDNFALVLQTPAQASSKLDVQLNGPVNLHKSFSNPPYALFGIDELTDDLLGNQLPNGQYNLQITYYCDSSSVDGTHKQFNFEIDNTLPQFVLVDADTDKDIQVIQEGDIIDLDQTNTQRVSIRAEVSTRYEGLPISQVEMTLESDQLEHSKIERLEPFALFGGEPRTNYFGRELLPNQYTVKAVPKFGDKNLIPLVTNFELKGRALLDLKTLRLVNANTRFWLSPLTEEDTAAIQKPDEGLSIIAEGSFYIESVRFVLSDATGEILFDRVENLKPYALLGDTRLEESKWTYLPWYPEPGEYTLAVTGYAEDKANGVSGKTRTVRFKILGDHVNLNLSNQDVYLYPNPLRDAPLHVSLTEPILANTQLRLLDKQGQVIIKQEITSQEFDLNVQTLKTGYYILEIITPISTQQKGLVIY